MVSARWISLRSSGVSVTFWSSTRVETHSAAHAWSASVLMLPERAEGEAPVRAADVVVLAPDREGQRQHGAALVDREHLRLGVASELRRDQAEERRLTRAGRAEDAGMADVTRVQIDPHRRRAGGGHLHEGRGLRWVDGHGLTVRPAHTALIGSMSARLSVWIIGRRMFWTPWPGSEPR